MLKASLEAIGLGHLQRDDALDVVGACALGVPSVHATLDSSCSCSGVIDLVAGSLLISAGRGWEMLLSLICDSQWYKWRK